MQNRIEDGAIGRSVERTPSRRQFISHHAQAENVAASIERLPDHLLGRKILDGPLEGRYGAGRACTPLSLLQGAYTISCRSARGTRRVGGHGSVLVPLRRADGKDAENKNSGPFVRVGNGLRIHGELKTRQREREIDLPHFILRGS